MINKQDTFDTCALHLLTQWKKSEARVMEDNPDDLVCAYRAPGDLKCALGCLIPEEKYDIDFENRVPRVSIGFDPNDNYSVTLAKVLGAETEDDCDFLRSIQIVHDSYPVVQWPLRLAVFAVEHKLSIHSLVLQKMFDRQIYGEG